MVNNHNSRARKKALWKKEKERGVFQFCNMSVLLWFVALLAPAFVSISAGKYSVLGNLYYVVSHIQSKSIYPSLFFLYR